MLIRDGLRGVLAGLCIALGGSVFLASENKVVGAFFFSVALLTICYFGFSLYTGKVGDLVLQHTGKDIGALFTGLLGNAVGCVVFGTLVRFGLPALAAKAELLSAAKLGETAPEALIRSFFCGVLMYVAVWIFRNKKTVLGIFICIPVFILSGFEHSVANMFYFATGAAYSLEALLYTLIFILGNSLGAWVIPALMLAVEKSEEVKVKKSKIAEQFNFREEGKEE
ncbi:MAG: formate/nitrite transporter family protein [Clostridia bacterium]|nr:formate/nitrite transporter family protein [Clostridia bacterium]